jgi:hypothetical protein
MYSAATLPLQMNIVNSEESQERSSGLAVESDEKKAVGI